MRKVIFYIDNMNRGGAQRVMTNLCEYYAEKGVQVLLVNDYPSDGKRPTYELSESVNRIYLQPGYVRNPISNNIKRVFALRKILKNEKPDLAMSFLGGPNIRLLLGAMGLKQKVTVSVRNDPTREYAASGIKKLLARKIFERADGCVFQTEEAKSYFTERVQSKSAVIFNPVDDKFYSVSRNPQPGEIVTAGRMNEQKRQDLLVDAFKLLAETNPEAKLIIYGDGPLRENLSERIRSLGLNSRVSLPGNVSNVEDALNTASLFVLPSDYEGMPNALMEAMAVGVPCISTDCPCGGPKVLDGHTGAIKLVKCGGTEELYQAMLEILENKVLSSEMSKKAKKRAELFKPEVVYAEWETYLTAVAGDR